MHSIHVSAFTTALPSSDDDADDANDDDAELTCGHKGAPGWSDRGKPLISAHSSSQQNNHPDEDEHHQYRDHLDPRQHHHHLDHDEDEDEKVNRVLVPASVIPAR